MSLKTLVNQVLLTTPMGKRPRSCPNTWQNDISDPALIHLDVEPAKLYNIDVEPAKLYRIQIEILFE